MSSLHYLFPPNWCEVVYTILDDVPDRDPMGHPDQIMDARHIHYGTEDADDGMQVPWLPGETVFLNSHHTVREPKPEVLENLNFTWYPLTDWLTKASICGQRGTTVITHLPASTDRKWFHHIVSETATSIAFLKKRIPCLLPSKDGPTVAPDPKYAAMLVLWTRDLAIYNRWYEVLAYAHEVDRVFGSMRMRKGRKFGVLMEPNPLVDPAEMNEA
jgi:hypothetical protein